jgi:hypothetical protein
MRTVHSGSSGASSPSLIVVVVVLGSVVVDVVVAVDVEVVLVGCVPAALVVAASTTSGAVVLGTTGVAPPQAPTINTVNRTALANLILGSPVARLSRAPYRASPWFAAWRPSRA